MNGPTFSRILELVAAQAGLKVEDLKARQAVRRGPNPYAAARRRAVLLARRLRPDLTQRAIGIHLGGRDASTIHSAELAAERQLQVDPRETEILDALLAQLGAEALPPRPPADRLSRLSLQRDIRQAEARLARLRAKLAELEARP